MSFKNELITLISFLLRPQKRKIIAITKSLKNKYGIEIGGPSPETFSLYNIIPAYVYAKQVDGVNFSNNTIWEGNITAGNSYSYFQQKRGYQYIADATNLAIVESNKYDFVLSSHSLEHIANPIRALKEWNRVLKKGGRLFLVLPDKNNTFDIDRTYTSLQHLIDDYKAETKETDLTHIQEIISHHNFSYDKVNTYQTLREKLLHNFETRVAHHHVFNLSIIAELLKLAGFETSYQQTYPPFHLITIATKND